MLYTKDDLLEAFNQGLKFEENKTSIGELYVYNFEEYLNQKNNKFLKKGCSTELSNLLISFYKELKIFLKEKEFNSSDISDFEQSLVDAILVKLYKQELDKQSFKIPLTVGMIEMMIGWDRFFEVYGFDKDSNDLINSEDITKIVYITEKQAKELKLNIKN